MAKVYCLTIAGQGTYRYPSRKEREEKILDVYGDGTYCGFLNTSNNPYTTWEEEE